MEKKFRLLKAEEIEVKVKQATEKGAVALIYKTSRVDMDILDETVGAENWADDYKEIHGNLYCGIGLKSSPEQPFVWKWDCGIESRELFRLAVGGFSASSGPAGNSGKVRDFRRGTG